MRASLDSPPSVFSDPVSDRHTIGNGFFEAIFQPLAGGRMLRLRHVDHGDVLVPLHNAAFDPSRWPKAGAFPLFPFHNRLHNAAFMHDGHLIRLKPNAANGTDVMHGPAHRRSWNVIDKGPDFIEMRLEYRADQDWPFDFTADQRFELFADHLTIDLSLTNTSGAPAPGGVGWHPYFRPPLDGRVVTDAHRRWEPLGPMGLPKLVDADRFTGCDPIEANSTRHYSDWTEACARIGRGARVTLAGGPGLTHLVVHRQTDYLCLEPASHVSGAFAALPALRPEAGLAMLAPGQTLAGTAKLRIDRL